MHTHRYPAMLTDTHLRTSSCPAKTPPASSRRCDKPRKTLFKTHFLSRGTRRRGPAEQPRSSAERGAEAGRGGRSSPRGAAQGASPQDRAGERGSPSLSAPEGRKLNGESVGGSPPLRAPPEAAPNGRAEPQPLQIPGQGCGRGCPVPVPVPAPVPHRPVWCR